VPVPLPGPDEVLLVPPSVAESTITAQGVAAAVAPDGRTPTETQRLLLEALFPAMTGASVDLSSVPPTTPEAFAEHLRRRNLAFRTRGVQVMVLGALVLDPVPAAVADRIGAFARELGVDDGMLAVAQELSAGAYDLAARDFDRNGYTQGWERPASALHTSAQLTTPWDVTHDDPDLARRWRSLGELSRDTLGRRVHDLYVARGFAFPGLPGSAPPLLAQHDWVHVLADFGTTVESELEVFALIARANDDMRAFSLLAMVVSLFETGSLERGAGLFEASPGHLSRDAGVAVRMADAMRRGALARWVGPDDGTVATDAGRDSIDFLGVDWFDLADLPVEEARRRFSLVAKSRDAVRAGSAGPWERGGISPYQLVSGRALAVAEDRPYDSFGASSA
jgi:hypothetical protein